MKCEYCKSQEAVTLYDLFGSKEILLIKVCKKCRNSISDWYRPKQVDRIIKEIKELNGGE